MSEYKPITGKVRCMVDCYAWRDNRDFQDFIDALDAIDSVHSQLERENEDLRMKYVNANRHALHMERENESLKAELDRVLGADTWESIIYDAMQAGRTDVTVDVTPLIERCKALCERTKEDA